MRLERLCIDVLASFWQADHRVWLVKCKDVDVWHRARAVPVSDCRQPLDVRFENYRRTYDQETIKGRKPSLQWIFE